MIKRSFYCFNTCQYKNTQSKSIQKLNHKHFFLSFKQYLHFYISEKSIKL